MHDIYLIRHTTPAVAKGICYGQTDLGLTDSFDAEADIIRKLLPADIGAVYSSPLLRCTRLAESLFPGHPVSLQPDLMEVFCGDWEMRHWDQLPKEEIEPWMADFVNIRIPGGESYTDLHDRVSRCFSAIAGHAAQSPVAVIAHGGVIRSILSGITDTPLIDSFKVFALYYGCVVRVFQHEDSLSYEILSNIAPLEKEQHKPTRSA
jgi:alpha-ribazole phosphatase